VTPLRPPVALPDFVSTLAYGFVLVGNPWPPPSLEREPEGQPTSSTRGSRTRRLAEQRDGPAIFEDIWHDEPLVAEIGVFPVAQDKASGSIQPAKEKAALGDDLCESPESLPEREPGRGRDAGSPVDIPRLGWRDILFRVWRNIAKHRILALAAGTTFYALLAIFPGIGATLALYGLFVDPHSAQRMFDQLSAVLPGGGQDILRDQVTRLTAQPSTRLGFAFLLGLTTSLWSASSGVRALIDTLNIVYGEDEKRGLVKLYLLSLAATLVIIVFFLIVSFALIAVPIVLNYIWIGDLPMTLLDLLRWPILFCIAVFALAVVYRYGPSRREARWRWITWGSALATVLWLVASLLFSWYAANFGSYNTTYGSLGAVVGFMTWVWISSTVLLLGAEVNAETEHQTVRDTTVGRDKPIGHRGAWVADTKGKAQN
jgi:membrane protein